MEVFVKSRPPDTTPTIPVIPSRLATPRGPANTPEPWAKAASVLPFLPISGLQVLYIITQFKAKGTFDFPSVSVSARQMIASSYMIGAYRSYQEPRFVIFCWLTRLTPMFGSESHMFDGWLKVDSPCLLLKSKYFSWLPSGYLTVCHGKSPFLRTVNHLFLWAIYTMAMLVITRG